MQSSFSSSNRISIFTLYSSQILKIFQEMFPIFSHIGWLIIGAVEVFHLGRIIITKLRKDLWNGKFRKRVMMAENDSYRRQPVHAGINRSVPGSIGFFGHCISKLHAVHCNLVIGQALDLKTLSFHEIWLHVPPPELHGPRRFFVNPFAERLLTWWGSLFTSMNRIKAQNKTAYAFERNVLPMFSSPLVLASRRTGYVRHPPFLLLLIVPGSDFGIKILEDHGSDIYRNWLNRFKSN
jgi:hypothetical protein